MKSIYNLIIFLFCSSIVQAQLYEVVTDLNFPNDMVLSGDTLYIAEFSGGKISKMDITDPAPTVSTVIAGLDHPSHIALNGDKMYISEFIMGKISKIDIDNNQSSAINILTNLHLPRAILINGVDLFFLNNNGQKLSKINLSDLDSPITDVVNGISGGTDLVLIENYIYIAEANPRKIIKIDITNPSPTIIDVVDLDSHPQALAVEGEFLYIAELIGLGTNGQISRININDQNPFPIQVINMLGFDPLGLLIHDNELYISHDNKISKLSLHSLSVANYSTVESFKLYPNPSHNFIHLVGLSTTEHFNIYDISGKKIDDGFISDNKKIDIQNLVDGVYFLKIDNYKPTLKFVKN